MLLNQLRGRPAALTFFMITDPMTTPNDRRMRWLPCRAGRGACLHLAIRLVCNGGPVWALFLLSPLVLLFDWLRPGEASVATTDGTRSGPICVCHHGSSMRALSSSCLRFHRHPGSSKTYRVPEPKAGEIQVRVGAAGVSFAAMLGVQGKHQNKPRCPMPGNELAGHVTKLGPASPTPVSASASATSVSQGAFASIPWRSLRNAIPIPETMPLCQATNFSTFYPTAYGALKWKADMQPARSAAGSMARAAASGLTARSVGKAMGAMVIALGRWQRQARGREGGRRRPSDRLSHATVSARLSTALTEGARGRRDYDPVGGSA